MPLRVAAPYAIILATCLLGSCAPPAPPAHEPQPLPVSSAAANPSSSAGGAMSNLGGSANVGAAAGSNVGEAPRMCGGLAGVQCGAKEYCSFAADAHCGAADMSGTCAKMPDSCIQMVDEVCGCDDKTYSNACMAAQAGVSVASKGACAPRAADVTPEGGLCGTRGASRDCAPGLYCAYKSDCGATDRGGACTKQPSACTKIYKPVCGCDSKTYGNACEAAAAGVSVARQSACKP